MNPACLKLMSSVEVNPPGKKMVAPCLSRSTELN